MINMKLLAAVLWSIGLVLIAVSLSGIVAEIKFAEVQQRLSAIERAAMEAE